MKVEQWMKRKVHTAAPRDDLLHAWRVMMAYRIRHLPVVDPQGALVGILSDRDIKKHALPIESGDSALVRQEHLQGIRAEQAMVRQVVTISPQSSMVRAAGIMRSRGIDSLPVVSAGRLAGMLTSSDFLEFFAHYFGMGAGDRLVHAEMPNTAAAVLDALGHLQPAGGRLPNIMIKGGEGDATAFITLVVPTGAAEAVARALSASADAVEPIG